MRKIRLSHTDGNFVEIYDESDENIDEYCDALSKLLSFGNISILKTSSSVLLVRPSQIQSIHVEDLPDNKEITEMLEVPVEIKEEKSKSKITEDVITDK